MGKDVKSEETSAAPKAGSMMAVKVIVGLFVFALVAYLSKDIDIVALIKKGKDSMDDLESVLVNLGPIYGPMYVFLIYLACTVFMLPLWGFHMTCGWVYGTGWAALLISATQALCAGAAFFCSRHIVGPYIRGYLERKYGKKFQAIDAAVQTSGLKITLLLRLSPLIPFGMNNYVCGCTGMKLWHFVVGTFFGVMPGNIAYCNLGSLGKTALDQGTTPLQKGVMALGVVAALVTIKVMSNLATDALKEAGISDEQKEETTHKGKAEEKTDKKKD